MKSLFLYVLFTLLACHCALAQVSNKYVFERSFFAPVGTIFDSSLAPDSRTSAVIDYTHTIRVWNTKTGQSLKVIPTYAHKATILKILPFSNFILTGGMDGVIKLHSIASGGIIQNFSVNLGLIKHLQTSKNGSFFIASGEENKIIYWKLNQFIGTHYYIPTTSKITALAVHPSGNIIAWTDIKGNINLWSLLRQRLLIRAKITSQRITHISFDPSGRFIAFGGYDKNVSIWNWKQHKITTVIKHKKPIINFGFTADSTEIMVCTEANKVYIWNINTKKLVQSLQKIDGTINTCAVSSTEDLLQVGFLKTKVRIFKKTALQHILSLQSHKTRIRTFDASKDGRFILSNDISNQFKLWDLKRKIPIGQIPAPKDPIFAIRFSPDSKFFALGGENGHLSLWDTNTKKQIRSFLGYKARILSIAFHPTKPLIAAVGEEPELFIWNYKTKALVLHKKIHKGPMTYVSFSKNGDLLAVTGTDKTTIVLNTDDFSIKDTFTKHKGIVNNADFSYDDKQLATASADLTSLVWDLNTKEELYRLNGHEASVARIYFLPNNQYLLSAGNDKTVRLWFLQNKKFFLVSTLKALPIHISELRIVESKHLAVLSGDSNKIYLLDLSKKLFIKKQQNQSLDPLLKSTITDFLPEETIIEEKAARIKEAELLQKLLKRQKQRRYGLASISSKNFFIWKKTKVNKKLLQAKKALNNFLDNPDFCKDKEYIKKLALNILKEDSTDKAAYYALILTSLQERNTMPILLFSKLGSNAYFDTDIYNFMSEWDLDLYFLVWDKFLFDHTSRFAIGLENIELRTCNDTVILSAIPEEYIFLDIPNETKLAITQGETQVDFTTFTKKTNFEAFRKYIYILNELIANKKKLITQQDFAASFIRWRYLNDTILQLDFSKIRQWDKQNNTILFKIKPQKKTWQTYNTDTSKFKILFVPNNHYYIQANGSLKKYVSVSSDSPRNSFFNIQ